MQYVVFFEFDTQYLSGEAFFNIILVETTRQGKSGITQGLECGCWGLSSRSYSHVQGVTSSVPTRNVSLRLVMVASSWNRFFLVFTVKACIFLFNALLGKAAYDQLFEIMVGKWKKTLFLVCTLFLRRRYLKLYFIFEMQKKNCSLS